MDKFITVFKREYLERVRTRSFVILTVIGPVLLGALMIIPAYLSVKAAKNARIASVRLIDATGTGLGKDVREALIAPRPDSSVVADSATIKVVEVTQSELAKAESDATALVVKKGLSGYVVLDTSAKNGATARYAGRNASSVGEIEAIQAAIRSTVLRQRLEKEGLNPSRIAALTNVRLQMPAERIDDKGRGGSGKASTILGVIVAVLLYFSLVLYGQNTLRSVLEEKTTRVAEVIVASVSTDILLAGKVLAVSAVGLTQQVLWLASAFGMYTVRLQIFAKLGLPPTTTISLPHVSIWMGGAYFAFFLLGFVFYSSLFAAAGSTVSSDQEAQQAAQPIMLLIVASFILIQPILFAPMSTMAKVMSWMPFSAPIVMPLRMSVVSLAPMEIILVLLGLVAASAGAIWVSSKIYRVGMLMYGKKPSFRELGRWIASS